MWKTFVLTGVFLSKLESVFEVRALNYFSHNRPTLSFTGSGGS